MIKETLVAKLKSADEPQKIKQEEEMNDETSYHVNQNAKQRMKTQGSYKEGKENEKSPNRNMKITNKTEDEDHKTINGPSEEQAEII